MIPAFPKIFAIGERYIQDIFKGPVEITEKVDGSQFVFGKVGGVTYCRSKGKMIEFDAPEKMFIQAVEFVLSMVDILSDDTIYFSEYLGKPKHNVLCYDRVPKNNLALFGIANTDMSFVSKHEDLKELAEWLGIDVVPLLFSGVISKPDDIFVLIEREGFLGGPNVEGVVVKNYGQEYWIGGKLMPLMCGKYVSEKFKEKHQKDWKKENTGKGKWQVFCEGYRAEARWQKAVQHLRDNGDIEGSPRDIGKLIKEIQRDIIEEENENIRDFLWKQFGGDILRKSIAGFPEWYKEQLVNESFNGGGTP